MRFVGSTNSRNEKYGDRGFWPIDRQSGTLEAFMWCGTFLTSLDVAFLLDAISMGFTLDVPFRLVCSLSVSLSFLLFKFEATGTSTAHFKQLNHWNVVNSCSGPLGNWIRWKNELSLGGFKDASLFARTSLALASVGFCSFKLHPTEWLLHSQATPKLARFVGLHSSDLTVSRIAIL